jgi:prepilin-type N-terminal cleavage/methylation domain-containing protein
MNQQGFSLVEVLVSIALLGTMGVGFLGALTTSSKATTDNSENTRALNLAEGQMEYVRSQGYDYENAPPQYQTLSPLPPGYSIECVATRLDTEGDGTDDDDGLQKIVVAVKHAGNTIITLESYRIR